MSDSSRQNRILTSAKEIIFAAGDLKSAEVSVCISLYNYGQYILEALESARAQTYEPLALIVLDDCSTDSGPTQVEAWMRDHAPRFAGVCFARHTTNSGLAATRNSSLELSYSPYVMILDADNRLLPRCIDRLTASLEASDSGFAYPILAREGGSSKLMGTEGWDPERLAVGNYIDAMVLLRRSTWQDVGGYARLRVQGWEDYDFWCKCVEAGISGLHVPEILACYRAHETSMLRQGTDLPVNTARIRREIRKRHPWLKL